MVDDHPLVREGIRTVLQEKAREIKVVGEASRMSELLNLLEKNVPDIVLLDISLPGRNGLDVLEKLKNMYPALPVLALSIHPEKRFALRALKTGAAGYLNKRCGSDNLIAAIETIAKQKKRYITAEVGEELANKFINDSKETPHEQLSNREYEVLILITKGKTMNKIADDLTLDIQTIYTYRKRIKKKLNFETDGQLIRYGIEHDLLD